MSTTTCSASKTLHHPPRTEQTVSWRAELPPIAQPAYHRWSLPSGEEWITFHRDAGAYVLSFPELAHFRVDLQTRHVHCTALHDVSSATVLQLFNHVMPLVLNGQRATVLHAGAVEVDAGAIAFVGPTGLGKSTLTGSLAARGHRFLADDALQVRLSDDGEPSVTPGQPHLRLWNDSAGALAGQVADDEKCRIPAGVRFPHCDSERPLTAVYLLGSHASAQPRFEPVRPAAALLELVQNSFLIDPEASELLELQHAHLSALVSRVPVFRLTYARRYDNLPHVCAALVAHARSCQRA